MRSAGEETSKVAIIVPLPPSATARGVRHLEAAGVLASDGFCDSLVMPDAPRVRFAEGFPTAVTGCNTEFDALLCSTTATLAINAALCVRNFRRLVLMTNLSFSNLPVRIPVRRLTDELPSSNH